MELMKCDHMQYLDGNTHLLITLNKLSGLNHIFKFILVNSSVESDVLSKY